MAWGWGCLSLHSPVDTIRRAWERVLPPGGMSAPWLCRAGWARVRGWTCTARQKAAAGPLEIALGSAVCSWCGFGHVSSFLFPGAHMLLFVVQLGERGMNVKTPVFFTWKTGIIGDKRAGLFVSVNEKS